MGWAEGEQLPPGAAGKGVQNSLTKNLRNTKDS